MYEKAVPNLEKGNVHLYFIEIPQILNSRICKFLSSVLSVDEKEKWKRFRFQKDRDTYLLTRALVRTQLSKYLNKADPKCWEFVTNQYGKPYLVNNTSSEPLYFNVSHTQGYVICVFSLHDRVGVDIEYLNDEIDIIELASQYFAPAEIKELFKTPLNGQIGRFYEYWTMKEAYTKAIGLGLSKPLNEFCIEFQGNDSASVSAGSRCDNSQQTWILRKLNHFKNCKAAICMEYNKLNHCDIQVELFKAQLY